MDIEFLRTFLEVNRTRHFGRAAENLHISQSTASARIKQLEDVVGAPLFTRTRNDIELTPAGARLLPYAESLVAGWQRARQEFMGAADAHVLSVAGVPSLWEPHLLTWLARVLDRDSRLTINAESLSPEAITRRLSIGSLDLAFAFEPVGLPGIEAREVLSLSLTLVSTRPVSSIEQALADYVYVDWGTAFSRRHAAAFPALAPPRLRLSTAHLAQTFLEKYDGTAYLADSTVATAVEEGRLFVVPGAPVIRREAYALFPQDGARTERVRELLHYLDS